MPRPSPIAGLTHERRRGAGTGPGTRVHRDDYGHVTLSPVLATYLVMGLRQTRREVTPGVADGRRAATPACIKPATPRLNGKAGRSHRIDAEESCRLRDAVMIDDTELFNDKLAERETSCNYHRPHGGPTA